MIYSRDTPFWLETLDFILHICSFQSTHLPLWQCPGSLPRRPVPAAGAAGSAATGSPRPSVAEWSGTKGSALGGPGSGSHGCSSLRCLAACCQMTVMKNDHDSGDKFNMLRGGWGGRRRWRGGVSRSGRHKCTSA